MPYLIRALGRGWPLALLVVLGCLALGADVGEGQQRDICGCANDPTSLGGFNMTDPTTYPPGTTRSNTGFGGTLITIPLPPSGVLVFNSFTTQHIGGPGCCTFSSFVRFTRNAANTPVTILVKGDVLIDVNTDLGVPGDPATSGSNGINGLGGLGGPGGFRGGDGAYQFTNLAADGGAGFGPGGGTPGTGSTATAPQTQGQNATFVGIPELLPLVGGSGGGGGASSTNAVGCSAGGAGGGGGALLIAANGTITVNGTISGDGGTPGFPANGNCSTIGGTGSGGAVRLVTNQLTGTGLILARAGSRCPNCGDDRPGSRGIIRLEAFTNTLAGDRTDPPASRALAPGPLTSPITTAVAITRINGQTVPTPPQGVFGVTDLVLPTPGTVPIDIRTTGVPGGTTVQVTVKPRVGGAAVSQSAALSACDSTGVCTTSTAFDLPPGEFLVEARATFQTP